MNEFLWVEKYRPQTIADTILPKELKQTFQNIIDSGEIPNMLFTGTAGLGKTTVARAICNELGLDYIVINGSEEGNIDTLRGKIKQFASSVSLSGGYKVVILDEADYLNPQSTQPALRGFIEEFSNNCRFILTCNYVEKIIDPIQSRCQTFQIVPPSKKEVAVQLDKILKSEDVNYDVKDLVPIIDSSYPDIRKVINTCQLNSVKGVLKLSKNDLLDSDFKTKIVDILKASDDSRNKYMKIRQTVADSKVQDFTEMYSLLYDKVDEYASGKVSGVILVLAEGQHRDALAVDKEIPFMATILNILSTINK